MWNGRAQVIVFTANVRIVDPVRRAREALTRELEHRGATVLWVDLPELPGVNGKDDFAGQHTPEEAIQLLTSAKPALRSTGNSSTRLVQIQDLPPVCAGDSRIEY